MSVSCGVLNVAYGTTVSSGVNILSFCGLDFFVRFHLEIRPLVFFLLFIFKAVEINIELNVSDTPKHRRRSMDCRPDVELLCEFLLGVSPMEKAQNGVHDRLYLAYSFATWK
jgi:hypothetical protein